MWISSGRQIPTREQPLHLGLSTSGAGAESWVVSSLARATAAMVAPTSASSMAMVTRLRDPAK